jgi:hypothetical protein
VGTVSAAATLGGLVNLDALDDQVVGVETLAIGVGLGVLEQIDDVLSGLDGPAGLGDTELLAYKRKVVSSKFLQRFIQIQIDIQYRQASNSFIP